MMPRLRLSSLFPVVTIFALLGPVGAGVVGAILPAFGHFPAAGMQGPSTSAFFALFDLPGIGRSIWLSISTGFLATCLALVITALILAGGHGTRAFELIRALLSPLLSVPHAAVAFGLAFLIAPSGWVVRVISPWLTGWERPPDLLILNDPAGLSIVLALIVKEVPFLLLMSIAAVGQVDEPRSRQVFLALGYDKSIGWLKAVFPRIYRQIRLPVLVVLAYSMSVVDVALILGPTTPPTLAVQIVRLMSNPDLSMRAVAAAGALLQLGLVAGALLVWWIGEMGVSACAARWTYLGGRGKRVAFIGGIGQFLGVVVAVVVIMGLFVLGVWSVAGYWGFPDAMPESLSFRTWARHGSSLGSATAETALIALVSTLLATVLTVGCLESEYRRGVRLGAGAIWILYMPLLIPQIAFLPGLQTFMITVGADMGLAAVIAGHVVFVLPYVFLSLAAPWRAWDARLGTVAMALGANHGGMLWKVRLPMLVGPVLTATAVGIAVSVGQYLPTLLIGGGRVETLTTETVALASGGDRRAIGVYALGQTVAALLPFAVAIVVPRLLWRNRRGVLNG